MSSETIVTSIESLQSVNSFNLIIRYGDSFHGISVHPGDDHLAVADKLHDLAERIKRDQQLNSGMAWV